MDYNLKISLGKIFLITFLLYPAVYGQMSKFPYQDSKVNYTKTNLISAPNNDLLFFWIDDNNLFQSRSTNNGQTWSEPLLLPNTYIEYYAQDFYITAYTSVSGRIFLMYNTGSYYVIYSDDNGLTWSSPSIFNFQLGPGSFSQSPTGKLFYIYGTGTNPTKRIYYITSMDSGLTWSYYTLFSSNFVFGSIAPVQSNKLMLVYQNKGIFYSLSSDDGVSWGSPVAIDSNDSSVSAPQIIKDQSGILWLFYQKLFPTPFNGITQQDIVYKTSPDGGLTWGTENNFTAYKGADANFHASFYGNNPLVTFTSDRGDSLKSNYSIWYGTAGVTQDVNAPPYLSKSNVSINPPLPQQQFNIYAYVDCAVNISTVTLNRYINGNIQSSPVPMYDDGTHGDSLANDKIYTCSVPGLNSGEALQTTIKIIDHNSNSGIYAGPNTGVPLNNSLDSVLIDVNRFKMPVTNNGILADKLIGNDPIWGAKYDGNVVMFSGGLWMSGISNNFTWSNGSAFYWWQDYQPGNVGTFPQDPKNMLYVVRSSDPPYSQSWQDWKYAVSQGADFYDGNHDGIYNPVDLNGNGKWDSDEDRPDLLGDITAWCVYNDNLPALQRLFPDVYPQGIEIQQTVFAQRDDGDLNNVIFVRYRIINKGTVADVMDSVYFGSTGDLDIGDSGANDLVGCDTLLNSGYIYHHLGVGDTKFGANPPAEFITLAQGPFSYIPGLTYTDVNNNSIYDPGTDIPLDTAFSFKGPLLGTSINPGAKNLPIYSSFQYYGGIEPLSKFIGRYYLMGREMNGELVNPCSWGQGTVFGGSNCGNINPRFMYSGDPVTNTGWVNTSPQDQKLLVSTGPFKLVKDKPVDIIIAHLVGRGSDPLNSVSVAKSYAATTINYCKSNFPNSIINGVDDLPNTVNNFRLDQNYPNPFNPSTKIRFSIRTNSQVTIKIINILGKDIATILNEQKHSGEYTIDFNAGKYNLASGVYFYKLTAGSFTSVKKMLLLK